MVKIKAQSSATHRVTVQFNILVLITCEILQLAPKFETAME